MSEISFLGANKITKFEILTKFQFKWPRFQQFCLGFSELLRLNPAMKNICTYVKSRHEKFA